MIITVFYAQHLLTCIWVYIGADEALIIREGWYTPSQQDKGTMTTYVYALYFILCTMTTVGYGDMSSKTSIEQIFCVIVMTFGVLYFATISGSLTSMLATMD